MLQAVQMALPLQQQPLLVQQPPMAMLLPQMPPNQQRQTRPRPVLIAAMLRVLQVQTQVTVQSTRDGE